ncbi:hypothetical protein SCHPADRAFT_891598 [Schizopora paradoxa]|uniref:Uncharacterized protein n=1 Tax=Schizopora paradoxa TaxID=27342 RepID=A0A0H2RIJ4_9AGAM|nr:hypothetical protein SCHPADRAFT_891598 [Schizopora paradoxa]
MPRALAALHIAPFNAGEPSTSPLNCFAKFKIIQSFTVSDAFGLNLTGAFTYSTTLNYTSFSALSIGFQLSGFNPIRSHWKSQTLSETFLKSVVLRGFNAKARKARKF